MMRRMTPLRWFVPLVLLTTFVACSPGWKPGATGNVRGAAVTEDLEIKTTKENFLKKDSSLQAFFDEAYGFVIFPTVGKGALLIGGAHGDGKVYEQDKLIGFSSITQLTIGLQAGGQAFSQIIFFKDKEALDRFTRGNYELSAQASAVVASLGAAGATDYENGVAIFVLVKGGLMYEVSVGGQKFSFQKL